MNDALTPPAPPETVDIRRHRQITTLLFAVVIGVELSVGLLASAAIGGALVGLTVTLAAVVLRGQWLVAQEMQRASRDFASEQVEAVYRDRETGLPNRSQLIDDLVREIARSERYDQPLTLAVVDIERLDDLGKLWGNEMGEKAVQHVAETLKRVARTSDVLARVDKRRFAVLLAQCDKPTADAFADRLRMAVMNRPVRSSERMRVPVYIDVAVSTLLYSIDKYRGPLEFLSVAGGDVVATDPADRRVVTGMRKREDVRDLRRQLLDQGGVYPDGQQRDFVSAYGEQRSRRVV